MTDQTPDLDLGADSAPDEAPAKMDLGSADRVAFRTWDGRRVVMRRLTVGQRRQIAISALKAHPDSAIAGNILGTEEAVKASLVSVGDQQVGQAGVTSEHLFKALSDKGREHATAMWALMSTTTEEEDAAFLASIEAL